MILPAFRLVQNTVKQFGILATSTIFTMTNPENYKEAKSIYEFSAKDIKGNVVSLDKYKGHVCIIVNVASQCGYTKNNYAELAELYNEYAESKGLRILGKQYKHTYKQFTIIQF